MRFRAQRLPAAPGGGPPSARLRLCRQAAADPSPKAGPGGGWRTVAETVAPRATRNPRWEVLTVSVEALCGGDATAPLRLQVRPPAAAAFTVRDSKPSVLVEFKNEARYRDGAMSSV